MKLHYRRWRLAAATIAVLMAVAMLTACGSEKTSQPEAGAAVTISHKFGETTCLPIPNVS